MFQCRSLISLVYILLLAAGGLGISQAVPASSPVLPPGILPVVVLSGSDYEMGYQYGMQAAAYIQENKIEAWSSALQQYSREEVLRTLKANQHYIRKHTPQWIDMMKGMADGASAAGFPMEYTDILLLNCSLPKPSTSTYPAGAEKDLLPPKSCSVCSAWGSATKDGRLVGMDTLDGSGDAFYGVVIAAYPDKGHHYLCAARAGEIGDHFLMNDQGLMVGNSGGGGSPRDIDDNYGLSWSCSLPHIVRFAGNAAEARDMILGWQINIPENFHLVDTGGGAFVVEKTAAIQSVRKPGDFGERDFLFSTNNYLNKEMKVTKEGDFVKQHGGYGAYSAPRNLMLWDMLHNYHGQVDAEFVKMILRFPGEPPPYPPAGGWDAKICRPSNSWVAVLLPHKGDEGVAHICTGPAGRVIHSSKASDGSIMRSSYLYIDGTRTFYRLRLAADPGAMVKEARKAAREDLAAAYKELMHRKLTETGTGLLEVIYSKANAEFYEGNSMLNRGLLAGGNEALRLLGQAATAFTRAQAHARQVYEALVPPATSPLDLGLRPFGGDWAQWESSVGKPR
ncbi:MAG: hypothetical protein FJW35_01340 [Acidobacteria bacterium]|nr:hypothetical protein [Acidobacteriota bacterium]